MAKLKTKKICKKCGKSLRKGAIYCSFCGEKVNGGKHCRECGARIKKKDNFCIKCGTEIDVASVTLSKVSRDSTDCKDVDNAENTSPDRVSKINKTENEPKVLDISDIDKEDIDTELIPYNDSGFYRNFELTNKVVANTNKYFYYAKLQGNCIYRINRDKQGSYVFIQDGSSKEERKIEALAVIDGILLALISFFDGTIRVYSLEYYSPELKYLKSERITGLDFIDACYPSNRYSKTCKMDADSILIYIKEIGDYTLGNTDISAKIAYYNFEDNWVDLVDITATTINNIPLGLRGRVSDIDRVYKHYDDTYFVLSTYQLMIGEGYRTNKVLIKFNLLTGQIRVIWDKEKDGMMPLSLDFENNKMWTVMNERECSEYNLKSKYNNVCFLCARELSSYHKILQSHLFRRINKEDIKDIYYFDNLVVCTAPTEGEFNMITGNGDKVNWMNRPDGGAEEVLFWKDWIFGDIFKSGICHWWPKRYQCSDGEEVFGALEF